MDNIYKNDVLQNADKHRLLTLPNKEHKVIRWTQQQMSQKQTVMALDATEPSVSEYRGCYKFGEAPSDHI